MATKTDFTISLIDDDAAVLKGLMRLLHAANFESRSYQSPRDFLESFDCRTPGCVIIDLSMDDMNGLELQEHLQRQPFSPPLIFLTGTGDIPASVKAMRNGAVDFLTKPVNRETLFAAIGKAMELDAIRRKRRDDLDAINKRLSTLTRREREVFGHVVTGRLNKQIAAVLGTVEKTVKVHRGRMMTKLGVHCVADLVRLSERAGIGPAL